MRKLKIRKKSRGIIRIVETYGKSSKPFVVVPKTLHTYIHTIHSHKAARIHFGRKTSYDMSFVTVLAVMVDSKQNLSLPISNWKRLIRLVSQFAEVVWWHVSSCQHPQQYHTQHTYMLVHSRMHDEQRILCYVETQYASYDDTFFARCV